MMENTPVVSGCEVQLLSRLSSDGHFNASNASMMLKLALISFLNMFAELNGNLKRHGCNF